MSLIALLNHHYYSFIITNIMNKLYKTWYAFPQTSLSRLERIFSSVRLNNRQLCQNCEIKKKQTGDKSLDSSATPEKTGLESYSLEKIPNFSVFSAWRFV